MDMTHLAPSEWWDEQRAEHIRRLRDEAFNEWSSEGSYQVLMWNYSALSMNLTLA